MSDTSRYEQIFENNRRWVAAVTADDPDFFSKLSTAQNPDFLYIGCADSRVPANQIMGVSPGAVFVHRNIANLVVNTDLNGQSVIQYAVGVLGVKHIVVCGHYGCGGVQAAMKSEDVGLLNPWLREIRDVYRLHRPSLTLLDEEERYRHLVELNVREQCVNVIKTAVVQKHYLHNGYPTVHGWVYDLHNGLLKDLHIDFEEVLREVQQVYRLY